MESISVPTPRPDRGLTATQRRALLAMAPGPEMDTASIAEAAGVKPNGAALALRGLERRGLVRRDAADPACWTVTFLGHGLLRRLTRAEQPAGGATGRLTRADEPAGGAEDPAGRLTRPD